jgi:hypothetical protein
MVRRDLRISYLDIFQGPNGDWRVRGRFDSKSLPDEDVIDARVSGRCLFPLLRVQ